MSKTTPNRLPTSTLSITKTSDGQYKVELQKPEMYDPGRKKNPTQAPSATSFDMDEVLEYALRWRPNSLWINQVALTKDQFLALLKGIKPKKLMILDVEVTPPPKLEEFADVLKSPTELAIGIKNMKLDSECFDVLEEVRKNRPSSLTHLLLGYIDPNVERKRIRQFAMHATTPTATRIFYV